MRPALAIVGALCLGAALALLPADAGFYSGPSMPAPCSTPPSPDTLNGSAGSADCYVPRDATRATVVQAANVTTDAAGGWKVIWARPFASSEPVVNPLPVNAGTLPILCNVGARTGAAASGKCWQATSTTVSGVVGGTLSTLVSPFASAAGNAAVMVIAREPTQ